MCNLYSMLKSQQAMRQLFEGLEDRLGNLGPLPGIYPTIPPRSSATKARAARW